MPIYNPIADNMVKGLVLVDTAANRPAAGTSGRWFIASDTLAISYDNGSAWVTVGTLGGLDIGSHVSRHEPGGADPMRWTADKLLKGAGDGSDPTEVDSPEAHAASHQNSGSDEVSVAGLSGELADRQKSKVGDSTLGWTADKLLKGAGSGSSPVEIDVPSGGATIAFPGTEVFSGNAPTSFTDLDLSSVVGSNSALVLLRVLSSGASSGTSMYFRKNGDTAAQGDYGTNHIANSDNEASLVIVVTDASGIIEWMAAATRNQIITVEAYVKA